MLKYPTILEVIEDLVGYKLAVLPDSEPDDPSYLLGLDPFGPDPLRKDEPTISGLVCPLVNHKDPWQEFHGDRKDDIGIDFVWRIFLESNLFWCCNCAQYYPDGFVLDVFSVIKILKGFSCMENDEVERYLKNRWNIQSVTRSYDPLCMFHNSIIPSSVPNRPQDKAISGPMDEDSQT